MRLAFVSPCFHDRHYGGVQCAGQLAAEGLEKNSAVEQMKVLCYGPNCTRKNAAKGHLCSQSKAGALVRALSLRGGPDRLLFWHLDLLKLLPLIGSRGKRIFLFLHGIECWRTIEGSLRALMGRVDVFLTNSDFTWQRFTEMNPWCRDAAHRTVALGVGTPGGPIDDVPEDNPAAVIIARMHRSEGYKGHRELIEAWPLVLKKIPGAELLVVGGGDGIPALQNQASLSGVAEQIRFMGVVSEDEKAKLLRRARCLVMPSRGEGFGLVYLEAMRLGRPCLSSIFDAGQEVIHPPRTGIAVDPRDTQALAGSVVELLTAGPAWERRSIEARRIYEEKFTAEHYQRRLLSALMEEAA